MGKYFSLFHIIKSKKLLLQFCTNSLLFKFLLKKDLWPIPYFFLNKFINSCFVAHRTSMLQVFILTLGKSYSNVMGKGPHWMSWQKGHVKCHAHGGQTQKQF